MENAGAIPEKPPIDSGYPPTQNIYHEVNEQVYDQVAPEPTSDDTVVVLSSPNKIMSEDANNDGVADDALFEFPGHVRLDYDSTVSEPDYFSNTSIARALQPVTACLKTWFNNVQVTMYYILYILLGAVFAFVWGLVFGIVNFATVWFVQPFIKLFFTAFRCAYMVSRAWTRMFCDPCFESVALALSKINGNFNVNKFVHQQR